MTDILSKYKNTHFTELPTPAFIINEDKFNLNCQAMLKSVNDLRLKTGKNILFRPHVKTHKTGQGTVRQLGHGVINHYERNTGSILVSTFSEARGILDYQESLGEKYVDDIAFSIPVCIPQYMTRLANTANRVKTLRVFVDNEEHLNNLVEYGRLPGDKKWSLFVKLDMGTHRAGVVTESSEFQSLLKKILSKDVKEVAELYGFYAHCGHSYHASSASQAYQYFEDELKAVNNAAKKVVDMDESLLAKSLVLSVGATPTTTAVLHAKPDLTEYIRNELIGTLEVHCGNYCLYDLQQVSTGCVAPKNVAGFVLGSVLSSYPTRAEMLTDTGVLALSRETSTIAGFGYCINPDEILNDKFTSKGEWYVDRLSQEHGILKPHAEVNCPNLLKLGSKVTILPQHACITMAQFSYYFIVNKKGTVVDVWTPFQKW